MRVKVKVKTLLFFLQHPNSEGHDTPCCLHGSEWYRTNLVLDDRGCGAERRVDRGLFHSVVGSINSVLSSLK